MNAACHQMGNMKMPLDFYPRPSFEPNALAPCYDTALTVQSLLPFLALCKEGMHKAVPRSTARHRGEALGSEKRRKPQPQVPLVAASPWHRSPSYIRQDTGRGAGRSGQMHTTSAAARPDLHPSGDPPNLQPCSQDGRE